jgi:hypothetical protein
MARPIGVFKKQNEYARAMGKLYARTPKAVLAAIVVSLVSNGGENIEGVTQAVLNEWDILHANGIVPQPAPRTPREG